ncbi:MAG TPA: hypothetical protein VGZ22_06770 [Isosphaeraceae bacterium]|jgi:hypothetical protein|nr:hypothetical protein [Isosphaeraceae bacterium]
MQVRIPAVLTLNVLALGLALGTMNVAAKAATAADLTGTWKSEFTNQNGDKIETTYKLKQDGDKVTGVVIGRNNMETEIKDGKVKDGTLSFTVTRERNGQTFTQKYSGKLEGDSIKGKIEFERNGETMSRDWEAKKAS